MKVKDYYDYLMSTDSLDKIDKNTKTELEYLYNVEVDVEDIGIDTSPILFDQDDDEENNEDNKDWDEDFKDFDDFDF